MTRNRSGSSFSIKMRMLTLAGAATLGVGSMLFVGWYENAKQEEALLRATEIQAVVEQVNEMRLANINMVLAAMDSIIDREEGAIQPERAEIISQALAELAANQTALERVALESDRGSLLTTYRDDLAVLSQAIQQDLTRLIEQRADAQEFGAIDDAIDGAGGRVSATLDEVATLGNGLVSLGVEEAKARSRESLTIQLTLGGVAFLSVIILQLIHGNAIVGGINRIRRSMQSIVDGDFERPVEATNRRDEIGEMARSAEVFRLAAIEKLALEERTKAESEATQKDREARAAILEADSRALRLAVDALAEGLTRLSEGDLSTEITADFPTELVRLRTDFNLVGQKLRTAMTEIAVNSSSIRANSHQMRAAADDLAKRTEQQAASLEESSAALAELTATVNSAAERAEEASRMVAHTKERAEESGAVVSNATLAMGRIQDASNEIGKIINVIDEIAFQTNLLALNAGVEAARAGDAGKGFAVVAQEVRALAGRAGDAARDIKTLVSRSTQEVGIGVELVTAAGQALSGIGEEVVKINDLVKAIVTSAREQSTGLSEINEAVGQMDQVTQQNAAMVEQTNAASHTLASDAEGLTRLVGQFRMNGAAPAHGQASTASAAPRPIAEPPQIRSGQGTTVRHNRTALATASLAKAEEHWEEF